MNGCEYCTDYRFIEPAKDVFVANEQDEIESWVKEAREKKQFLEAVFEDGFLIGFNIVEDCPKCGYKFTEADYNER